jgi:hypothetical protein
MEYMALMKDPVLKPLWQQGFSNEIGRFFQGIRDIQGTNTCLFVNLKNIPKEIKFTYGNIFLRLQTSQEIKGTRQAHSGRRQI